MPDRVIRDELLNSERWLSLPRNSHRLAFVCLLLTADALGNMEASDGRLWRLWRDPLRLDERKAIPEILEALVAADLARIYPIEGKRFLHIPRYRQRLRYLSNIRPLSPWTTPTQIQQLEKNSPGDSQERTRRAPAEVKRSEVKRSDVDLSQERLVAAKNAATRTVATRLAEDWKIPEDWIAIGLAVHPDWSRSGVIRESLTFRDYWCAKSGKDATKMKWLATWRNWIRKADKEPAR